VQLDRDTWLTIVRHAPLISIDLVVTRPDSRVLLGLRENEPACDTWFVPGGRILKNERLADAFARLTRGELGHQLPYREATLLGAFEHLYDTNFARQPGITTHYVVLAHRVNVAADFAPEGDAQHRELRWWTAADMGSDPRVHPNTRAYAACL